MPRPPKPHVALCLALALLGPSAASICPLPWNADASMPDGVDFSATCPYGRPFPISKVGVTIPNDADMTQLLCVAYGIIPFWVIGWGVVHCIVHTIGLGGIATREFCFLGFTLFIVILNEAVFKNVVLQARPEESCNFSCGFPSGHSTMAVGFFALLFFDASYRVMSKLPMSEASAREEARFERKLALSRGKTYLGLTLREWKTLDLRALATLMPLSKTDVMTPFDFIQFVGLWGFFLLPVPVSRLVLKDHTPVQVLVGGVIGVLDAMVFFIAVRRGIMERYNHRLGTRVGYIFVHNYPLPRCEVISKCWRLLVALEGRPTEALDVAELEQLVHAFTEIHWYMHSAEKNHCGCALFDEDRIFLHLQKDKLKLLERHLLEKLQSADSDKLEIAGWRPSQSDCESTDDTSGSE